MDFGIFYTPYLAIDYDALIRNLSKMRDYARRTGTNVRPHAKTHKSPDIARLQMELGCIGVTCAKLGEAQVMVDHGINDILIANQVVGREKVLRLAELCLTSDVKVSVDSPEHVRALSEAATFIGSSVGVVIEVDVGMGRCGVRTLEQAAALSSLIRDLPGLDFRGLLGYEGHAVMLSPREARQEACEKANAKLVGVRRFLEEKGYKCEIVSAGGTGTYDITGSCKGITEIEPGSYVFMDAKYSTLDIPFEQALYVVTSVVSTPEDGVVVVDAGLKTVTTEFGYPVPVAYSSSWQHNEGDCSPIPLRPGDLKVVRLSEEHGILAKQASFQIRPGDKVFFVPSHICTTVNLHDYYYVFKNGRFLRKWKIEARGASY